MAAGRYGAVAWLRDGIFGADERLSDWWQLARCCRCVMPLAIALLYAKHLNRANEFGKRKYFELEMSIIFSVFNIGFEPLECSSETSLGIGRGC